MKVYLAALVVLVVLLVLVVSAHKRDTFGTPDVIHISLVNNTRAPITTQSARWQKTIPPHTIPAGWTYKYKVETDAAPSDYYSLTTAAPNGKLCAPNVTPPIGGAQIPGAHLGGDLELAITMNKHTQADKSLPPTYSTTVAASGPGAASFPIAHPTIPCGGL